jgi:predicted MFS family arabinose efflux permease
MTDKKAWRDGRRALLVALLSVNFGIVFFDRTSLNFLMPFVQPDLRLDNLQVGMTASALALSWAVSGVMIGWLSDRWQKRKILLVTATVAFSLCSFVSGLAGSFLVLLGARLLMGFAEGGVLPISQSLVSAEVRPEHRGIAMGVMQNFGSNLLGSTVAPLLLVPLALAFGWRSAFFVSGIPGLITAALIWLMVREREPQTIDTAATAPLSLRGVWSERNIILCMLIAALLISYMVVCQSFMPLFLTQVRMFDPRAMAWLMATLGISAAAGSFVIPGLSDRFGRRPVMIVVSFVGVILPLAALFYRGSPIILAALFFCGWGLLGLFPLVMATIPSETVDPKHMAMTLGLVMGTGEIVGGVFSPSLTGLAADHFGLAAPMWVMVGLCSVAGLVSLGLRETAPRLVATRHQQTVLETHR